MFRWMDTTIIVGNLDEKPGSCNSVSHYFHSVVWVIEEFSNKPSPRLQSTASLQNLKNDVRNTMWNCTECILFHKVSEIFESILYRFWCTIQFLSMWFFVWSAMFCHPQGIFLLVVGLFCVHFVKATSVFYYVFRLKSQESASCRKTCEKWNFPEKVTKKNSTWTTSNLILTRT